MAGKRGNPNWQKGVSGNPGGRNRDKPFLAALNKAIAKHGDKESALLRVAKALLDKAITGDMAAINALMDRLDGKAIQTVAGDNDAPFKLMVEWKTASKV